MNIKIGILTSGGDSPGMNSIIYNITKECTKNNYHIYGIYNGYKGLYLNQIKKLNINKLEYIKNKGGTILNSSRFPELKNYEIRKKIIKNIKKIIDILIIVGGEGTYIGAKKLNDMNLPCITIPGTIDNDIYNTDYSIGYSTALNTITNLIDKIEDSSISHNRISIIEVMGRKCGNLAINSSLSCSSSYVIIPEIKFKKKELYNKIDYEINNNKKCISIITTENIINIFKLSKDIENKFKKETRATCLGYIQRGGKPISFDRILAYKMSILTIKLIKKEYFGVSISINNNKLKYNILKKKYNNIKNIDKNIINKINNI